jgi:hypothetical protein
MESKQTTRPVTPISKKDEPYNLATLRANAYKSDAPVDELVLNGYNYGRRQEYSESHKSKESTNISQNTAPTGSYSPSDDLYKNSAYNVSPSKYSDLAAKYFQDSRTKDPYDGPDSYNPPAVSNSSGTSIVLSGDKFPPLDLYETPKPSSQDKPHKYPTDIHKSPSLEHSHNSQLFSNTYEPPLPEDTYKFPALVDTYNPVGYYKPQKPEDSYGPPSLTDVSTRQPPLNAHQFSSIKTYKPPSPKDSYGPPSLMAIYKPPPPVDTDQPSLMETYRPPSQGDSYGPPSLVDIYKSPQPADTYQPPSMETYKPLFPDDSFGPASLMETHKPPSPGDTYGPPSSKNTHQLPLKDAYKPPLPINSHQPPPAETYKPPLPMNSHQPPPAESYKSPLHMDTYQPPPTLNIYNFSLAENTHKPLSSADDYKPPLLMDTNKRPLGMETYKPLPDNNVYKSQPFTHTNKYPSPADTYKYPSYMDISNLSPPPPPTPPMESYKTTSLADEYKALSHEDTDKPPTLNHPQANASNEKPLTHHHGRPFIVIQKFPPFKGPHKPHVSSYTSIKDSYEMPLAEDQHEHNSSSENVPADDDDYPEYDTSDHDTHDYNSYDHNTKDDNFHDDKRGRDHDHIYHHNANEYYSHDHAYDLDDHDLPATKPPNKDHYHHQQSSEYDVGVPHHHYRDHTSHHNPSEHYSYHHLHDYDNTELHAFQRPTKYSYHFPPSPVYTGEPPSLPGGLSPPKYMAGDLTPPSNGTVVSSMPPSNDMVGPHTSPPPDMTQAPSPPPEDMVGFPPPPQNSIYGASPLNPVDTYVNHLYPVEDIYGFHPPIHAYGTPTYLVTNMTEAPQTSTVAMEHKPPTRYYYLGRKLWLVPVYATGIFLVHMLLLLLKAISRHKVLAPYNFYTSFQSRTLKSQRQQQLDSSTEHIAEALETAEYRYM